MSYARLDLCCKDQKVIVNFNNDLWEFLDKTVDSDVTMQKMQIWTLKKHPLILKKKTWHRRSQNDDEEATHSAEEAKAILLKTKKDSEESIA